MAYLDRRETHFVLWTPAGAPVVPELLIGVLDRSAGTAALTDERRIPLRRSTLPGAEGGDVWEVPAVECGLDSGRVYHYWFVVRDTNAYRPSEQRETLRCTDPAATSVDWRLLAPVPPGYGSDDRQPAAVVRFVDGRLVPSDPEVALESFATTPDAPIASLPPNNRLVIYELPTAWTRTGQAVDAENVGVGTFRDVRALVDRQASGANFAVVGALQVGAGPPVGPGDQRTRAPATGG